VLARIPYTINMKNNNNKNGKKTGKKAVSKAVVQRPRRVTAPASSGSLITPSKFSMNTISEGVVRFRGHELLGPVSAIQFSPIAGVFDLNPACWINSRLARIASTYEKYRYDSFTLRYHPTVSTASSNALATYIELEIDEDAFTTVVGALNHQFSAMGPAWSGHEVTYRRPPQDPKAYLLTDRAVGNRNDMSQGKVVCVSSADGPQTFGYLSIEYDVVFMYPELESGYSGEQYILSAGVIPATAPNGIIVASPTWASAGVKVAEIVLNEVLQDVINAVGNTLTYAVGAVLYTAWDGAAWTLHDNIEQALSLVNPLRTAVGLPGTTLDYFVRKLVRI